MRTAVLAASVVIPSKAFAIDWTVGLGAGVAPDYEGSEDYEAVPLWNVRANDLYHPSTYVQILGPKLSSNLLAHENIRLGLSGQYVAKRSDVENNAVDNLSSTDDGVMLGILAGYDFKLSGGRVLGFEVDGRWDVKGDVGGLLTVRGKYTAPFSDRKWLFSGTAESTYASEDYMSEYFGIDAADSARSGLNQFSADADFKDVTLSAGLTYRITDSFSTTGLLRFTRLLGDAADSPVTDDEGDENQLFAGLLVNYHF